MSIKKFGIYLAYAPGLDLRHEGLGRYLAEFLKGAQTRNDIEFVIVCPSWSKTGLKQLFEAEDVLDNKLEIISPKKVPTVLRWYERYLKHKRRVRKPPFWDRIARSLYKLKTILFNHVEHHLVSDDGYLGILILSFEALVAASILILLSPLLILAIFAQVMLRIKRYLGNLLRPLKRALSRVPKAVGSPKDDAIVLRLYRGLERAESEKMLKIIESRKDIKAWYSPTAFWPAFNQISAPKLICVPDVVLSDFPVGFSDVGGDRFLQVFDRVEATIRQGENFVTYSGAVKWETLVDKYAVRASNVHAVPHAPNDLSRWVKVAGFPNSAETSINYCKTLLLRSMKKSSNYSYSAEFANGNLKFLFYASQFRPNKNLLTLLTAYKHLLKNKLFQHKLILTGSPSTYPVIERFIKDNHLSSDVLCLHGLSIQELSACYKLADFAVNPSLSEGGCPFTFTEALSVGTPTLMARIPVTEEILVCKELQELTFFDPYDWKDLARKIEYAIAHKEEILAIQMKTYESLSVRSWADVVNEHIEILENISEKGIQSR